MAYISEHDTRKAIITCLEVLEIKGDNPMIDKLQIEARELLRNSLSSLDKDWHIRLLLDIRKDVREKLINK
jgi:hypothetical protein